MTSEGCYFEYDYVRKTRLPYYSLNAYWPLWIGIASPAQAKRVANHLDLFDHPYGLTFTDKTYPGIHPEYKALEWAYPESWPQQQIVVASGAAAIRLPGTGSSDQQALHCQCGYHMGKNRTNLGALRRRRRRPQRPSRARSGAAAAWILVCIGGRSWANRIQLRSERL